jgi:hypothetical protein
MLVIELNPGEPPPSPQPLVFGMVTNGNHFMFIKLQRGTVMEYDFSDSFSLLSRQNCLYPVLQILKGMGQQILN